MSNGANQFCRRTRREFLWDAGAKFPGLALTGMLAGDQFFNKAAANEKHATSLLNPMAVKEPMFPAKAKAVIWLFMNGGPSQVDTWDFKPELQKRHDQPLPGFDKNTGFFTEQVGPLMKSPFQFAQHGQSGAWVSEIFPRMAAHVDDMAFIHSCFTKTNKTSKTGG